MQKTKKKALIITDISFEPDNYFYSQIVKRIEIFLESREVDIERLVVQFPPMNAKVNSKRNSSQEKIVSQEEFIQSVKVKVDSSIDAFVIVGERGATLCKPLKQLFPSALVYFVPLYSAETVQTIIQAEGIGDFVRYLPKMITGVFKGLSFINRLEGTKIITFHPLETALYKSWGATSVTEIVPIVEKLDFGKESPRSVGIIIDRISLMKNADLRSTIEKLSWRLEKEIKDAKIVLYATNLQIKSELEKNFPKQTIVLLESGVVKPAIGLCIVNNRSYLSFDAYFYVHNNIPFVSFAETALLLFKGDSDSLIYSSELLELSYKITRLMVSVNDYNKAKNAVTSLNKKICLESILEDKLQDMFNGLWNNE